MSENVLEEIEVGVLKIKGDKPGPDKVDYKGETYYRFMDFFYIQNCSLDELEPAQVSNLCRARAKYPNLISVVNHDVREVFKKLTEAVRPTNLLEIGVGLNPIFGSDGYKPEFYILADADTEIVMHYENLNNDCYVFSKDVCEIPDFDNFFEMVIAIFVMHFPFHKNQLLEIKKRLKKSGIVVANVYRRDFASRERLARDMADVGFKIMKVQDSHNLCRDHEYWVLGQEDAHVKKCAYELEGIIKKYS